MTHTTPGNPTKSVFPLLLTIEAKKLRHVKRNVDFEFHDDSLMHGIKSIQINL